MARPASTLGAGLMRGMPISSVVLTNVGRPLAHALQLDTVPESEQQDTLTWLKGSPPIDEGREEAG